MCVTHFEMKINTRTGQYKYLLWKDLKVINLRFLQQYLDDKKVVSIEIKPRERMIKVLRKVK